ncbi:HtaA domain-containing protein [Streptomyces himastatinicus]|nr:HtaA domain-containing protein [Streptomyces himastatinicus]
MAKIQPTGRFALWGRYRDVTSRRGSTIRSPGQQGGSLDASFGGAIRFTGHEGSLDLKFSDLGAAGAATVLAATRRRGEN